MNSPLLCAFALLTAPGWASQDPARLDVGDPAPVFDIAHWVKGETLSGFQPGKIYVMEFWATWCPPCRDSMPHLSELQKQYPEITILGVSDEDLPTVKAFLEKPGWAEKTQYTLAADPDRSVYESYMLAAGQSGIPTAFVVGKDGKIQWIGHPMEMDSVLASVVAGKWRVEAYREEKALLAKLEETYQAWTTAEEADKPSRLHEALGVMDQLISRSRERYAYFELYQVEILAGLLQDKAAAVTRIESAVKARWESADDLDTLAKMLLERSEELGLERTLAGPAVQRACELTGHEDPRCLATLALYHFQEGRYADAVKWQEKALSLASEEGRGAYEEVLGKYRDKLAGA